MMDYVTVAQKDELQPNERMVVQVGRRWVAIFNVEGTFYAIEDVCTHDDGPLAEGELTGCIIECPRHGATFDIRTGKVLSAPAMVDVKRFDVRVEGSAIQVMPR
ncbi:MAG: non-heme iron oxygenase ferredoxin subunit [Chloroflexi bacterium]|nr:non-heme iron oxygenase ferredoxin subunit [Chloroflexota bacterium]MCC6892113.1 non-heme iron oxygenase ferredoxin subunit [Anaerolineae bacterium]